MLAKYSTAGPRYTSYPTAPHFHAGIGDAEWLEELAAPVAADRALSLYVHVPFCDSLCYYCGCNMVATQRYDKVDPYLRTLDLEMATVAARIQPGRQVRQLHWGGGTPTYLRPSDIGRLMDSIAMRFDIAGDAELSCEADPRELTRDHLRALRESGFNRISFGVQDLDPAVQHAINRIQSAELIEQVYQWARELGFASINMDLITGLPLQTPQGFARTLERVIAWGPDRLAVFGYAHVPWMKKHQTLIRPEQLPDFATRLQLGEHVHGALTAAGYIDIGLDHFARPGDEMVVAQRNKTLWRNFQGYTTHKHSDVLAFGASAISQTEGLYAQNEKNLKRYQARVATGGLAVERGVRVAVADRIRRDAITRVMCDLELDVAALGREWRTDVAPLFVEGWSRLAPLAEDGLVTLDGWQLRVTGTGRRFLRNIAMCLDAYLHTEADAMPAAGQPVAMPRPMYSQTA
ncbi:MAG: oxygen-independent coproporphyrinogen III oxidase [Rhodocyclaceae bacterium]|nr:oxygen-independent coproporphyrinogen III oxidase [Rhodocyclaceae bacterium]